MATLLHKTKMYHTLVNPRHLAANDKPLRFGICPQNCKCRVITIFFFLRFDNSYNKLIVRFLSHGRCQATSNRNNRTTQTQNTKPNKTEKLGEAPKIEPNFEIDNVQHEKHRAEKQVRSTSVAGDTTARYSTEDCV